MGDEEHHCCHTTCCIISCSSSEVSLTLKRKGKLSLLITQNDFIIARVKQVSRLEEGSKEEGILKERGRISCC